MKREQINVRICEVCGENLKAIEWPWNWRGLLSLCDNCKKAAMTLMCMARYLEEGRNESKRNSGSVAEVE